MELGGELSAEFEEKLFGYYALDLPPSKTPQRAGAPGHDQLVPIEPSIIHGRAR